MSFHFFERLIDPPALLSVVEEGWSLDKLPQFMAEGIALLDQEPEPIYYIADNRALHLGLGDIVTGANMLTRQAGALLQHPNMRGLLMITGDRMMELAGKGLSSDIFGNVPVRVFATVEEAFGYIQEQVRA